ncbi:MAG: guanylate cyclase, partial [Dehalococcoidia bacterium]|nr:guanylate cyclase [Dehalococcoidia bacterium]
MPESTRKLAAIVFTDIVGFTELMGKDEKAAMALLEKQKRLLRPIIENFQGEWLKKIGDGTLSSFPSAVQAVTCALEIQRILDHDPELTVRIGIHIGDVIKKDGDVFGDGVNIASRLEPLAEPGGICVSERVYEDIRNKPEINSAFQDEQILKGLDRPIKVYSVFTKMGTVPQENPNDPKAKVQKS